jgi:transcriptional antiterminator NusG
MSNWYCIRTATRQEQKVLDGLRDLALERKIDLDVYLPCETRWNRMTKVRTTKQVPVIPGYLFLQIDAEHLWRVDKVEGVYQILGWAIRQTEAQQKKLTAFVNELREEQAAGLFDKTVKHRPKKTHDLKVGQAVRVKDGPFGGLTFNIAELCGEDRIKVLMSLFGRETPVELDAREVQPQDDVPPKAA